jgi:hypothetical protein
VFSIHHPIAGWQLSGKADYHRIELVSEQDDYDGQLVTVQMYRRPISAIFRQLRGAGFTVRDEEAAGSNPATPTIKLHVVVRFS